MYAAFWDAKLIRSIKRRIVVHRLSTIRNADRIVLVGEGRVKETGTHDELMALQGKYYEMFTKQAENYIG